jgi:hypothetical protein
MLVCALVHEPATMHRRRVARGGSQSLSRLAGTDLPVVSHAVNEGEAVS